VLVILTLGHHRMCHSHRVSQPSCITWSLFNTPLPGLSQTLVASRAVPKAHPIDTRSDACTQLVGLTKFSIFMSFICFGFSSQSLGQSVALRRLLLLLLIRQAGKSTDGSLGSHRHCTGMLLKQAPHDAVNRSSQSCRWCVCSKASNCPIEAKASWSSCWSR
jgi:hypothetical protein